MQPDSRYERVSVNLIYFKISKIILKNWYKHLYGYTNTSCGHVRFVIFWNSSFDDSKQRILQYSGFNVADLTSLRFTSQKTTMNQFGQKADRVGSHTIFFCEKKVCPELVARFLTHWSRKSLIHPLCTLNFNSKYKNFFVSKVCFHEIMR